jgi:hypothetical protein
MKLGGRFKGVGAMEDWPELSSTRPGEGRLFNQWINRHVWAIQLGEPIRSSMFLNMLS